MDRRTFLKGAATGALVGGLQFDTAVAHGIDRNTASNTGSRPGEWLQFRGDRALTGRSSLKGSIKIPTINWKQFCGGRETILTPKFQKRREERATILLPTTDLGSDPRIQIDEKKQALDSYKGAKFTSGVQVGKYLPEEPGMQIVECESCFDKYGSYQPPGTVEFCQLLTRQNGQWRQVWESEPIRDLFHPNVIVGDFDHDGKLEVAFTPWYDLWVLDMATGKRKAKCRFKSPEAESGRAYGYLGAFDVDGDGKQEFVMLADFENHLAVMGWRDGEVQVLWSRVIERGTSNKKTIVRPGAEPVQDIDGDGKMEIVVTLFNATGDNEWHVVALDALTGREKLDLPGEYLAGLHDIDGDGIAELFLTKSQGALTPEPSDLSIVGFRNGRIDRRWQLAGSSFQTRLVTEFPENVQGSPLTKGLTVLAEPLEAGGVPVFFTRKTLGRVTVTNELVAWQSDKNLTVQQLGSFVGPYLEAIVPGSGLIGEGALLMRAEVPADSPAKIDSTGVLLQPVFSRRSGIPISTAVVGRLDPESPPTVVVQGAGETIQAFRPSHTNSKKEPLWWARGRSMNTGGKNAGGVVLADLHGDGKLATLMATYGSNDCARLAAIDSGGKEVWGHDFDRFPGARPGLLVGGMLFWFVGRFTDVNRDDVMVSLRRSTPASEETYVLDGRNGKEIWHRTEGSLAGGPPNIRGLGGGWMAVYDHDGDGLDDAVIMYSDGLLVVEGRTGKALVDRSTNGRTKKGIFPGVWAFQAIPAVTDFQGNGKFQMLYGGTTYSFGLLDMQGNVIWQDAEGCKPAILTGTENAPQGHIARNLGNCGTPNVLQGIGDADGDGKLELLSPGHRREPGSLEQEFHCYDAATGNLKWKLPLPGSCFGPNNYSFPDSPTTPAVADIDGDGRKEAVFAIGKALYAVGASKNGQGGEIRWTLEFSDLLGPPTIADAEGDGRAEIIVVCADGYVYGIGSPEKARPIEKTKGPGSRLNYKSISTSS